MHPSQPCSLHLVITVPKASADRIAAAARWIFRQASATSHGPYRCESRPTARCRFDIEASWPDEPSLRHFLRSGSFARLLELCEASTEPPDIRFVVGDEQHGLDYAVRLREVEHV
jgi:hypothetical protein